MSKWSDRLQRGVAALAAAATLVVPVGAAWAGGGGGSAGGGAAAGSAFQLKWAYRDSDNGAFGGASISSVQAAMGEMGFTMTAQGQATAQQALDEANHNCLARFDQAHPDQAGQGNCRVVSVGAVAGGTGNFGGTGNASHSIWMQNWIATVGGQTFSNNGAQYTTGDQFLDQPGTSVDSIADQYAGDVGRVSVVVIMLNQYEPRPADYHLSASTSAQDTFPVSGGTQTVHDAVDTDAGGSSIRENLTATTTLNWYGYPTGPNVVRSASKPALAPNNDHGELPGFTPADFGFDTWPAGRWAYGLEIPKQGRMDAALSLPDSAPNEAWESTTPPPTKTLWDAADTAQATASSTVAAGVPYTARVTGNPAGSERFWLYDIIKDPTIFIGTRDHDDASRVTVTDGNGGPQTATVSIDRSRAGEVVVKAFVPSGTPRELTLHVPTYPTASGRDTTITDDSRACWDGDGALCQAGGTKEIPKRTPRPDKVWTVDEAGALVAQDKGHTNAKGKDNRYWVPGDPISAVVNGRIPAGLTGNLDSYTITDDWTGAARYIDFSNPSKAKVYVEGQERTGDFSITVSGTTTVARAKAGFLSQTKGLAADKAVKLIVSGTVRDVAVPEGAQVTNGGAEQWNDEPKETNTPAAFVRSPKPDKVWVLDAAGALATQDPNWTNQQGADTQTFLPGDQVGAVVNGRMPKGLATDLSDYRISDDWTGAAQYVDFSDASRARVYVDGVDRTGDFVISVNGSVTTARAKAAALRGTEGMAADKAVKLYLGGSFKEGTRTQGKTKRLTNTGSEQWNRKKVSTNTPPVFVWTPNPDKSWVALKSGNPLNPSDGYQLVIDPARTNRTGADNKSFRLGDRVASAVNATMPSGLARVPNLVLADDWGKASRIVRMEDLSHIRVYDQDAGSAEQSSIGAIDATGRDVTGQFDITVSGTQVAATPKTSYAQGLRGMNSARQITLLAPFAVSFDPAAIRGEYGKGAGDQVDSCTNPDGSDLSNKGRQKAGQASMDTNEPRICVTVPSIHKDVVAESSQGGDQASVDGKRVMPGQKLEYTVRADPKVPADDAYEVTRVAIRDTYDAQTIPDKQTLEITDLNTGAVIPRSQWTSTWDDTDHSFTASFGPAWVTANWAKGSHPRILLRFEARVRDDAPTDHRIDNQAWLTINNGVVPSNTVENKPTRPRPVKQDTQADPSISIEGKTALLGDRIFYRVNIDTSELTDQAYKVQRLGMIDDWDEGYLKLDRQAIQVVDETGRDMTDRLNIQVRDGVVYAFLKTVDTVIPATGETLKGDPQPKDLKAYSGRKLDPLMDPYIDQTLLGHTLQVVLPMTVIKVTDGYVVKNTATQVTNSRRDVTNTVNNPLKPINPSKDVVVTVGGGSTDGRSIWKEQQFLYQVDSSILPADRAHPKVTGWSIHDPYPAEYDQPTGQWAVYATRDLTGPTDRVLARKGERIAGSGFDSSRLGGELFTASFDDGSFTIGATQTYLDLVSKARTEQGWRGYVQMTRIKAGEHIVNRFTETLNGTERPSNEVETNTPDQSPAVSIVKYDLASGLKDGDRNRPEEALQDAKDGTEIGFRISNTGQIKWEGKLADLIDQTIAGSGEVSDIHLTSSETDGSPTGKDTIILEPGQKAWARGVLNGVKTGDHHTDRAHITVRPIVPCPVVDEDPFDDKPGVQQSGTCYGDPLVSDPDDWNGTRPQLLAETGTAVLTVILAGAACAGAGMGLRFLARRRKGSNVHMVSRHHAAC
ncbi:cell wall anchor protein [Bifidobacterium aemilianum]|uniref:Cell wall anchor protein n=1 Tax=Bifidobacterium aemilianum TaxID=2493120 RepID=A0A366K823_9BIFI|nr:LPXTG cell wall anchor domain-containing protein [Bifidobacterium aemilianum]RBP97819.1 cell wall anchor protein [Bifidobacterium aemilianum]